MEKLKMSSPDMLSENVEKIAALFPNCVTETAEGKAIDFDLLKQELNKDIVEGNKERYTLNWPGKKEAIVTANIPTTQTLRPVKEDSVNWDTTENLYIEGDNLEVLKVLQESYLNKVKMIYIDPPYNTGKDFVYKDNFTENKEEHLEESGQKDEDGNRLVANPKTAGRYHSDWLSMMYPRLKIARKLLKDDGVIFISIDDNEVHNLRNIGDEIFGINNFIGSFMWEKHKAPKNDNKFVTINHEHILVFSKDKESISFNKLPRSQSNIDSFKNIDNDYRGGWGSGPLLAPSFNYNFVFEIKRPNGNGVVSPPPGKCWSFTKERINDLISDNRIWFGSDGNNVPRIKRFLSELPDGIGVTSILLHDETSGTQKASNRLKKLFDGKKIFPYSKPLEIIKIFLQIGTDSESLVLDFFSGSASTAHAVMELNAEDDGNRKYMMVQLSEKTNEQSEAFKSGYKNICEIAKERIRRAGNKILAESKTKAGELEFDSKEENKLDVGFRVYRLDSSNMQDVYYTPQDYKQDNMDLFADNVKADRNPDDLLAQVMLDWGLPLSLDITEETILNKTIYKVAGNSLFACFDDGIDEGFAKEVAKNQPMRMLFKDSNFKDDTSKENVKQLLKQLSPETEMRVI